MFTSTSAGDYNFPLNKHFLEMPPRYIGRKKLTTQGFQSSFQLKYSLDVCLFHMSYDFSTRG